MSTQDIHNPDAELDDAHMTSAGADEAEVSTDTLTLDELNSLLGKEFPDKATALKSLKDTQSYVGKKKEDIAAEVLATLGVAPEAPAPATTQPNDPSMTSELNEIKTRLFYSENPQYKGHEQLIASMGGNPAEVVTTPAFQAVFEKLKAADEVAQRASVVSSSPRLAQVKSATDEAVATANAAGTSQDDVAMVFAKAINDEISENS